MKKPKRFLQYLPVGLLAVSLMAVYLVTMAPGLTWANYGADGGDLIAAAATGGVAHPSGYPTYLLLARLFQFLPLGSLAFRTNLMSALATVTAAVLVYGLVNRFLASSTAHSKWLPAMVAGFAFGVSPLVWSQAVITEVYALHSLFVAGLLFLSVIQASVHLTEKRLDCLLGLTFGLAMGNHLTILLLFPVIFSSAIQRRAPEVQGRNWLHHWQLNGGSFLRRLAWTAVGLMIYLTLPLRALAKPPVNWGNPINPAGFAWLVSGKLYQDQLFASLLPSIWGRIQASASLLLDQFGIIGLTISLIALAVFFKPLRLYWNMLWIVIAFFVFAIAYSTNDAFLYLIPAFLCFALWIGIGLNGLMAALPQRFRLFAPVIGFALILILLFQAGNHWQQVNASHDQRAEAFGQNVLSLAPARTIVFARGDRAVFSMWYFEYALHDRPDVAIVASDLLQFEWYLQTLRSTYPDLNLPGPFPFPETVVASNPDRPVCYVQFDQTSEINCISAADSTVP